MLWKEGLKEQRERKYKSKVTQESVERKINNNKRKEKRQEIQERKEESYLHK